VVAYQAYRVREYRRTYGESTGVGTGVSTGVSVDSVGVGVRGIGI
jgi:hypothetical protein